MGEPVRIREKTILERINRLLRESPDGGMIHVGGKGLGRHYWVEIRGTMTQIPGQDLEEYARSIGMLQDGEWLA